MHQSTACTSVTSLIRLGTYALMNKGDNCNSFKTLSPFYVIILKKEGRKTARTWRSIETTFREKELKEIHKFFHIICLSIIFGHIGTLFYTIPIFQLPKMTQLNSVALSGQLSTKIESCV